MVVETGAISDLGGQRASTWEGCYPQLTFAVCLHFSGENFNLAQPSLWSSFREQLWAGGRGNSGLEGEVGDVIKANS